jgi:hypothetical protein
MSDTITTPHTEVHAGTVRKTHPPGLLAGFVPVFTWGLRLAFRRKRFFVVLGLAIGIGLFLGFNGVNAGLRNESDGWKDRRLWQLLDGMAIQFLMPLCALVFVAGGFAREVSDRTLVYHLVRPIRRHTIFLARFAAGLIPGTVVMAALLGSILMGSNRPIPNSIWVAILPLSFFGMLVLGALYYSLASMFKRGAIAALAYTFVIEGLLEGRSGSTSDLALTHHIRAIKRGLMDAPLVERSTELQRLLARREGWQMPEGGESGFQAILRAAEQAPAYATSGQAMITLCCIAAALLAFGAWRINQKDFPLKD